MGFMAVYMESSSSNEYMFGTSPAFRMLLMSSKNDSDLIYSTLMQQLANEMKYALCSRYISFQLPG